MEPRHPDTEDLVLALLVRQMPADSLNPFSFHFFPSFLPYTLILGSGYM